MTTFHLVAGINLRALEIRLGDLGPVEECSMEAGWIRPFLRVKGVHRIGLKTEHRVEL